MTASVFQATLDDPFVPKNERLAALRALLGSGALVRGSLGTNSPVDGHLHSNYSDGYWTPSGLVARAFARGMRLVALTDHDGFAGIEEAFEATAVVNEHGGATLGFVPGIELSTDHWYGPEGAQKKKEVHLVGYFPCSDYQAFSRRLESLDGRTRAYLEAFRANRVLRIHQMVRKFNAELPELVPEIAALRDQRDPVISDPTVLRGMRGSIAPGRLLTSTGIFEVHDLHQRGRLDEIPDERFSEAYLSTLAELCRGMDSPKAFMTRFFDKAQPSAKTGYLGLTESPAWAVGFIRSLGGIPVLGHPCKYVALYQDLLEQLIPLGLRGVEVFSDNVKAGKQAEQLHGILDHVESEHPDLVVTIGSDCHGGSWDGRVDYTPANRMGLRTRYVDDLERYARAFEALLCG